MISFLLSFVSGVTVRERMDYTGYKPLQSYGMQKGGSIEFHIISRAEPGVMIFIPWQSEYNEIKSSVTKQTNACHNLEMFRNIDHFTSEEGSLVSELVYVANKTGVKVPIIANCGNQTISFSVNYMNPTSYFDTREMHIPIVTTVFSYIYFIITLVWIGNAIAFPRFRITIHSVFTLTCILKAISLNLSTRKWTTKGSLGGFNGTEFNIDLWFGIVTNTLLFSVNIYASCGWGIFRKHISWIELVNGFSHTGLFFISYLMAKNSISPWTGIIYGFVCFLSCFNYIGDITQGLVLITKLMDEQNNNTFKHKLKMAAKYTVAFSLAILLLGLCAFYNVMSFKTATIMKTGEEAMILLIAVLDIDYFFIHSFHLPDEEESGEAENRRPTLPDPESLSLLLEPSANHLAFISTEA